jgi:AcrR family transcriptional regulator
MLAPRRGSQLASPKRSRGRPTREDAKLIEEHLLRVATEVFIEQGYGGATMDGMAAAAGVGKHTLYSRYAGKKALFNAVVERLAQHHLLAEFADDESVTVAEGLRNRALAIVLHTMTPETLALYRIRQREMHQFPELAQITVHGARIQYINDLEAWLVAKMKAGLLPTREVGLMVRLFMPLIFGELNMALIYQLPLPSRPALERYIAEVVDVFLNGWMGAKTP